MRTIDVYKEDILTIGHSILPNEEGFVVIACLDNTYLLLEILLREILKCFGEEYTITNKEDIYTDKINKDGFLYTAFTTNLPWDKVAPLFVYA